MTERTFPTWDKPYAFMVFSFRSVALIQHAAAQLSAGALYVVPHLPAPGHGDVPRLEPVHEGLHLRGGGAAQPALGHLVEGDQVHVALEAAQPTRQFVGMANGVVKAQDGGVECGGGEALLHADFIREFRGICPAQWKINAETSLFVPRNYLAAATDAVDLFVVDCKDMNADIYRRYTGEDGAVMLDNLRFLLERVGSGRVIVRVPLIPGYNTEEDQKKSAGMLKEMGVERLDLFEYVTRN